MRGVRSELTYGRVHRCPHAVAGSIKAIRLRNGVMAGIVQFVLFLSTKLIGHGSCILGTI